MKAVALLLVAISLSSANAGPLGSMTKVAGTYGDLAVNAESGDLGGFEITLIPENFETGDYKAIFQCDEGWLSPVVMVPAKVRGDAVRFSVPAPSFCQGTVEGRITKFGFEGSHRNKAGADRIKLKRTRSFWD
jgi:hypothetical protein